MARTKWARDCKEIERGLAEAGFAYGVTGYRLVANAFLLRLHEGVTAALASMPSHAQVDAHLWLNLHSALHDTVDEEFGGQLPLLIGGDPDLAQAINSSHQQIEAHLRNGA